MALVSSCRQTRQTGNDSVNLERQRWNPSFPMHTKTKMCKFYAMSKCTRGDSCTFAHTFDELMPMPDYTRTRFCVALSDQGRCDGINCMYAHSKEELRANIDINAQAEAPSRMDLTRVAHRIEEQEELLGVDSESMWSSMMLDSLGALTKSGLPRRNLHMAPVKGTCEPCSTIIDKLKTIIDNLQTSKPVGEASKADRPSMDGMQTEQTALHTDPYPTHSDSNTEKTTLSTNPDHLFHTHTLRSRGRGSPQLTSWQVHVPTGLCYEVKNTFLSFYSAETPDQGSPTLQRRRARSVDSGSNQRCSSVP